METCARPSCYGRSGAPEVYDFGQALLDESRNPRKRDRTRALIQNVGCRLLDGTSLASLTVSQICREAGIAHGSFYNYFPDRQAFVADLLLRFVDYLQDVMRRASRAADSEPVRATTAAYFHLFEQNPGLMKCLVNHLEDFPSCREAFQKLNREWTAQVVAATQRNRSVSGSAAALPRDELLRRAYALGGMVDQYLTALVLNQDPTLASVSRDRDAVIDTLTLIWTRGLSK